MSINPDEKLREINERWGFRSMQSIVDALVELLHEAGEGGTIKVAEVKERALSKTLQRRRG